MDENETVSVKGDILIVDDTAANLKVLSAMLTSQGFKVRSATRGDIALRAAENQPPDLILLDIMMPGMDGYEVCRRLKADRRLRYIPVIFLSALDETGDKIAAFEAGGVDYITKPFQFEEVRARVEAQLTLRRLRLEIEYQNQRLQELVEVQVKEIRDSQMATIFALAKLSESRDDDTGAHLERVQAYCEVLAVAARDVRGCAEVDDVFVRNVVRASPLHDIGKVAIHDDILLKPGKLTAEEFEVMKTHAALGASTLEAVQRQYPNNSFISIGIQIARSHHERWGGGGYPDGLSGEDIPLCARIMAVADVYDALRSKRVYKNAFSHEESCDIMLAKSPGHFDPCLMGVFGDLSSEFRDISERPMSGEPHIV